MSDKKRTVADDALHDFLKFAIRWHEEGRDSAPSNIERQNLREDAETVLRVLLDELRENKPLPDPSLCFLAVLEDTGE